MTEKRKRAAPTIDLKATEVPPPSAAKSDAPAKEKQKETPKAAVPPPEPPPSQELPAATEPPPSSNDFIKTIAMPLAAGFAGALLGGAVVWGLIPRSGNDGGQVAALQKQIRDLQSRSAPAADTQAVDALRERLGKIEQTIASLPSGDKTVADRLTAADSAMKSLGVALAALNKRSDDVAANAKQADDRAAAAEKAVSELRDSVSSAKQQASNAVDAGQLAALQQRVVALEQSVKETRDQVAGNAVTDKAVRLAVSAAALRDAVDSGKPYQAELAQAKALGADDAALAPLASFAAAGVPSRQSLARELGAILPALVKAAGIENAPSGFLERLQANASHLVRFSAINAPTGDKPGDVLARVELAVAHDAVDAALTDIGKLPDKARQQAAEWVTKAVARGKALAAANTLASDAARGLAR
ncbi:MAG TPA: hypothetical protein VEJ40_02425 [Pseudolabrys sp.]|nr:hypothetical protein [Pseudolabrys sp.]